MSHVALIKIEINSLNSLRAGCELLGTVELKIGQKTYKWYGTHMGDYPLPEGFTKADLGRCDHAIVVKGANAETYEIGVVARRDGKPGFTLMWDFFCGGYGLEDAVGPDCVELKKAYGVAVAADKARQQGFKVEITKSRDQKRYRVRARRKKLRN